ncbi:glutamate-cysteine ligase family protein [Saccharopolyspora thermophila]|uniref:Glutamate--cysteine ligase n=1 Tax=Saccharopolyspora thermophila TaxID=89367 RepID=A0ABN1CDG9_9PSEU
MQAGASEPLRRDGLLALFAAPGDGRERIGLEVESAVVDPITGLAAPYAGRGGVRDLLRAVATEFGGEELRDGELLTAIRTPSGMIVSLEHGGAIEYSSAPTDDLATAVEDLRRAMEHLADLARGFGLAIVPGGNVPFNRIENAAWVPKPRGALMRRYFGGLGEAGEWGPTVMALALSTQTTLDYTSDSDLAEKVRMQVAASPVVAGMFVNSPLEGGAPAGVLSRRCQCWLRTDARRCGVLPTGVREKMTPADFVEWALGVPMIYRRTADGCFRLVGDRSFGSLLDRGFPDGTRPTWDDWTSHLSQVWTDVRVRRTLELRAADGPPYPHIPAVPALWVGLTYHRPSRLAAWDLLREHSVDALRRTAAEVPAKGLAARLGDVPVRELGRELLRLARQGLAARVAAGAERAVVLEYLDPVEEILETGTTFADRVLRRWDGEFGRDPARYVAAYRV